MISSVFLEQSSESKFDGIGDDSPAKIRGNADAESVGASSPFRRIVQGLAESAVGDHVRKALPACVRAMQIVLKSLPHGRQRLGYRGLGPSTDRTGGKKKDDLLQPRSPLRGQPASALR
jgi:hypothetical protein